MRALREVSPRTGAGSPQPFEHFDEPDAEAQRAHGGVRSLYASCASDQAVRRAVGFHRAAHHRGETRTGLVGAEAERIVVDEAEADEQVLRNATRVADRQPLRIEPRVSAFFEAGARGCRFEQG